MNYTTNYKLPQWEEIDRIQMEDFNKMCADIEAGLDAVKSGAAADTQALEKDMNASVTQIKNNLEQVSANLGNKGKNARFITGSYDGDDTYGEKHPSTLSFDFSPYLLVICPEPGDDEFILLRACPKGGGVDGDSNYVTWSEKSVSWYSKISATSQFNYTRTYYYIAFGIDA